jgi:hypothetical protein
MDTKAGITDHASRRRRVALVAALLVCGAAGTGIGLMVGLRAHHRAAGSFEGTPAIATAQAAGRAAMNPETYALLMAVSQRLDALEQSAGKQPAASGQAQPSSAVARDQRPTEEESAARAQRELQTFDATLKAEAKDAKWDAEFQARARTVLSAPELKGVSLEDVKCASTLCRAELGVSEDSAADSENVLRLLSQAAPHGGMWLNRSLLGPHRAVLFVARHGAGLPALAGDVASSVAIQ